jgi:hypothetical protein
MEICSYTNIECSHCENICDKIITPEKVAINLIGTAKTLLRTIKFNDRNRINESIDEIISKAKYFKSTFKY